MQNTTLNALAASIRVIGDELLTIADALKADATAAPLAQDAQQAFGPGPGQTQTAFQTTKVPLDQRATSAQQQQPPAQQRQFQQQQSPAQQQQPPAQQQQQQPPAQQQQQPPAQQQQFQQQATQTGGMVAPEQRQAVSADEFTAFSNALIDLGRQAGPQGLVPIMPAMLHRYATPPGNDLSAVPAASYGPFLEEVRAYIASLGGRQ